MPVTEKTRPTEPLYPPRLIRKKDAPRYLGMCESTFVTDVEPKLLRFPVGKRGIAFDRHELDDYVDKLREQLQPQSSNGRPEEKKGVAKWAENKSRGSGSVAKSGTSTRKSKGMESFEKALERVTGKKPSVT